MLRAAVLVGLLAGCASSRPVVAIRDVNVVDGTDGPARPHQTVLIRGDRIAVLGPTGEVAIPPGARVISGAGRTLIPGLWDMHAHLLWERGRFERFAPQLIAHGVTSARDMGGGIPVAEMREARRLGQARWGLRLSIAGPILDGPRPMKHNGRAIRTAAEGRRTVDELAAAGVDFIKVYWGLPREAYLAIVDQAARRHLPVAGHVPFSMLGSEVATAGQRSIEHLDNFEDECTKKSTLAPPALRQAEAANLARLRAALAALEAARWDDPLLEPDLRAHLGSDAGEIERTWYTTIGPPAAFELVERSVEGEDQVFVVEAVFHGRPVPFRFRLHADGTVGIDFADVPLDPVCVDGVIALFAARHTWQCPTLLVHAHNRGLYIDEQAAEARLARLSPDKAKEWRAALARQRPVSEAQRRARAAYLEKLYDLLRRMQRAGVPLLVGSDVAMPFSFPGFGVHDELAMLVRAGLTPKAALQAATREPARYAGLGAELGTIEPGKLADLVLLEGDPLARIENTQRIAAVVVGGRVLDRAALDALLESTRR